MPNINQHSFSNRSASHDILARIARVQDETRSHVLALKKLDSQSALTPSVPQSHAANAQATAEASTATPTALDHRLAIWDNAHDVVEALWAGRQLLMSLYNTINHEPTRTQAPLDSDPDLNSLSTLLKPKDREFANRLFRAERWADMMQERYSTKDIVKRTPSVSNGRALKMTEAPWWKWLMGKAPLDDEVEEAAF